MEMRHLQTFATAAELQSFTRTAEALSVTQSAVSHHVAALEKELRVSLFRRSGRSITPTDAGHRFYEYVRKVLDLLSEARRDLGETSPEISGTLRIATCEVPAETLLPALLRQCRQFHPQVSASVIISDSSSAAQAVQSGDADLAFVTEFPNSERLTSSPIACDELVLVVSPNHHLAGEKQITADRLREETFVVHETGSGSQSSLEQALGRAGIPQAELKIGMVTNSHKVMRAAVEEGIGVAFLPRIVVQGEIAEGRLVCVPVAEVQPRRCLYLVIDSQRIHRAAVRAFLSLVQEQPG